MEDTEAAGLRLFLRPPLCEAPEDLWPQNRCVPGLLGSHAARGSQDQAGPRAMSLQVSLRLRLLLVSARERASQRKRRGVTETHSDSNL